MKPLTPEFARMSSGLTQSKQLEKQAEAADPEAAAQLYAAKAANDYQTFEYAKTAGAGMWEAAKGMGQRFMGSPFGKGMAVAGGAAIPGVMALNAASDHASEQMRNRALEAGLGLAAVGGTLYGVNRLASKTASDEKAENGHVQEALLKLASVGYLDEMLAIAEKDTGASEQTRKLASEMRVLNREFGTSILVNLAG